MSENTIQIGAVHLNQFTKTIVPITANNLELAQEQSEQIIHSTADLAEWRLDDLDSDITRQSIYKVAQPIKMNLKAANKALLATVRTSSQGGSFEGDAEAYLKQYQFILKQEIADAIDVEYTTDPEIRRQILKASNLLATPIILSYHDFKNTPGLSALEDLSLAMADLSVSVIKIAVTPQTSEDVLTIFQLAQWAQTHLTKPLAIMGMGNLGRITRVSGNIFPSVFTFATLADASAPGQMPLMEVEKQLNLFQP